MAGVPWPIAGSAAAGVGTVFLVAYLWRYREKPGARWFLAALASQATWSFTYAAALFVFDPVLRFTLEVVVWATMGGTSVFFLAFALAYTGRAEVLQTWWFRLVLSSPGVIAVATATNPVHHLVWSGFEITPLAGMATVTYSLHPWALVGATIGLLLAVAGSLLLFDTVVSYGRLYRSEAIAVGFSTAPPMSALFVWLFGVGPVPELNLTTVLFLPHVVLDAYAFVGSDMFEFNPATRREGERAAIDDLGSPVVIVDEKRRVVTLNPAAEEVFGVDTQTALTRNLDDLLADPIALGDGEQRVTVRDGRDRIEFKVTQNPLRDPTGTHVGHTVVFQDVTDEIRREQRLEVLNRFLRHNVRNESAVIKGHAEFLADELDTYASHAQTIEDAVSKLTASGEKARTLAETADATATDTVAVADILHSVAASAEDAHGGTVTVDVPTDFSLETDPGLLEEVFANLVENGLEHGDDAVSVTLLDGGDSDELATFEVADDGPGIPDHEYSVLEDGQETALEHGSGLGLWLTKWATTSLGGTLDFDNSDGTTVTVRLPDATAD